MHLDLLSLLPMAGAGIFVGFVVGLTGMGGGALVTPMLVLFFGVQPLAAVSSDLVASLFMKPVGAFVHYRHRTVNLRLAGWLTAGSVPAAVAGVLLLRALGDGDGVQDGVRIGLGVAMLLAVGGMVTKAAVTARRDRVGVDAAASPLRIRPIPTLLIGVAGGFAVGMTSVGSGSLIIAMLLIAYPRLRAGQLVGTDLVQAIPLVGAAALAHVFFGHVRLDVTLPLLIGALPGVYLGAKVSARGSTAWIRPVLWIVLVTTSLKLVHVPTTVVLVVAGVLTIAALVVGSAQRRVNRRRHALAERALDEIAPADVRDLRVWDSTF